MSMQEEIIVQIRSSLGPFYRDCLFSKPMNALSKRQLKNSPHSLWEGLSLAPAIFSYITGYYLPRKLRSQGRTFDIDSSHRITQDPNLQGAPIGGMGCGFMTRSYLGSFTRYHFRTGDVKTVNIPINQFSLAVHTPGTIRSERQAMVLNPSPLVNRGKVGKMWNWWDLNADPKQKKRQTPPLFHDMTGVYHCRFPYSFYEYEKPDTFRIVQKQYSPVIPHDYENSSLPVGVFRHGIENLSDEPLTFSMMFTFQNGTGENDRSGGHFNIMKKGKIKRKIIEEMTMGRESSSEEEDDEEENEGESEEESEEKGQKKEEKEEEVEVVWVEMHNAYKHHISTGLMSSANFDDPLVFGVGVIPEGNRRNLAGEGEGGMEFEEITSEQPQKQRKSKVFDDDDDSLIDSDYDSEEERKKEEDKKSKKKKKKKKKMKKKKFKTKSIHEGLKEESCDDFEISVCETFRSSSKHQMNSLWEMFEVNGSVGDVNEYIRQKRLHKSKMKSSTFFGLSSVDVEDVQDDVQSLHTIQKEEEEPKSQSPMINLEKSKMELLEKEARKRGGDVSSSSESIATAVCVKITVSPKQQRSFAFILGFHHPIARFQDNAFTKQYMKYFHKEREQEEEEIENEKNIPSSSTKGGRRRRRVIRSRVIEQLMRKSFQNYEEWDRQITAFQEPILQNSELPEDYKLALFNELYFLVAGGTVWTHEKIHPESGARTLEEHFGLLEGQEYHMYNTYDVYVYGSFAVLRLFPEIQKGIQIDFANFITSEDDTSANFGGKRKVLGAVPHDLGTPHEAPFEKSNSYAFQNTNRWKDLGSHFVCSLCRDVRYTKDKELLERCFPAARMVMEYCMKNFVNEKHGLIENEGFPDQTYDQWSMKGVTSYCGVLWMAALASYIALCQEFLEGEEKEKEVDKYALVLVKASKFFEKYMWVKEKKPLYYRHSYNPATKKSSDSLHLDALLGHLFLRSSELHPVLKISRIGKAIRTMYSLNVKKGEGVNGMKSDGTQDESNQQAKEVWVGSNYAFAAILMYEGFRPLSFSTVRQIHFSCWRKFGFFFQTPEAYFPKSGTYRALAYCRPLAIWAVQMAYEWSKRKEEELWKENLSVRLKKAEEEAEKKKKEEEDEEEGEEEEDEIKEKDEKEEESEEAEEEKEGEGEGEKEEV